MTAIIRLLAGGAAIAALAGAPPAAAQYYPGYGTPYGGYGYGGYGYGMNSQVLVSQCAAAVQARLGGYRAYGYGGYGGGRVLGVSEISPRGDGGIHVKGVATSGSGAPDLRFDCRTDGRGVIRDLDISRTYGGYGYGYSPYNSYDYSPYGYRRY